MAGGVIKGRTTTYVYVNNFDTDEPVMKTVYGKRPEKKPSQAQLSDAEKAVEALLAEDDEQENGGSDSGETVSAEEARVEREKLIAEHRDVLEALTDYLMDRKSLNQAELTAFFAEHLPAD